ncbi:MAG: 50S ribosomal protein L4 [Gemmatimonadales bacterium]
MLEAQHYTAAAKRKGRYALPDEFDGRVNRAVLHQAVRTYLGNRRQGTHSTKTRAEVSGGTRKPWRQKGTGRARQGSTRAAHWTGGGVVFGPKPRDYTTALPRKVKRLARQSALNQRAVEGALFVIEALELERSRTRLMVELLDKLGLADKKVLLLTADRRRDVLLSSRNIPGVRVLRYRDVSALDVLWADAVVVEEQAIGGRGVGGGAGKTTAARARRTAKAASVSGGESRGKAGPRPARRGVGEEKKGKAAKRRPARKAKG